MSGEMPLVLPSFHAVLFHAHIPEIVQPDWAASLGRLSMWDTFRWHILSFLTITFLKKSLAYWIHHEIFRVAMYKLLSETESVPGYMICLED